MQIQTLVPASVSTSVVAQNSKAPGFIPALDGLRGLAILAVMFFHLGLPLSSLGWSGVELFFVISGYLITRILLNSRDRKNYFKTFYTRRTLRIFPIYYMVLVIYTIVLLSSASEDRGTLPFYYVYLQTIPQIRSLFHVVPMLGHTWTLAIEEQFYFIWPLAVFFLRGRKLVVAAVVMLAASPVLRVIAQRSQNPFLVDAWLGVQMDALAAGALIAYATTVCNRTVLKRWLSSIFVVGAAGMLCLIGAVGLSPFWTPIIWARAGYGPFLLTIMIFVYAGAVGLAALGSRGTRWLEFRPLMRWGKLSYGAYLYHPFVFLLIAKAGDTIYHGHNRAANVGLALIKLVLTYLVAWTSWQVIEGPINRLKERFQN